MNTTAETGSTLQQLSDPALITLWSLARVKLALGDRASRATYDAARAEYERRMGEAS
jgi:hypothetical protein